nr:urease subunit B [Ureaplasma urealyticum]
MSGSSNQFTPGKLVPGAINFAEGENVMNEGREAKVISIKNTGDRPIQVGSHLHLFETNSALVFFDEKGNEDKERKVAYGRRFDILSTAIRFEPGDKKEVSVIDLVGTRWSLRCKRLS